MAKRAKIKHEVTAADREGYVETSARDAAFELECLADSMREAGRPIPAWMETAMAECKAIEKSAADAWHALTEQDKATAA